MVSLLLGMLKLADKWGWAENLCSRRIWFGHAPTPIWFSGLLGWPPEHMLMGLANEPVLMGLAHEHMPIGLVYEHMPMGLAHEHVLMGLAHGHMLMGQVHEHMLRRPSQEAEKPNWRWRVTKPIPVRSTNTGFPPNPYLDETGMGLVSNRCRGKKSS